MFDLCMSIFLNLLLHFIANLYELVANKNLESEVFSCTPKKYIHTNTLMMWEVDFFM